MYTALLLARALTTKVSYVPGASVVLDPIRRWGTRCEGTIVVNDFDGDLKFELSLTGDDDSRIFWYGALAQPVLALLHRIVRQGHTVVDVGAGAGEIALFTAKRVGESGRVVALEPREAEADRLARNLALNSFDQVDVLRMAPRDVVSEGEDDPVTTLDALLDEGWFTQLDVLKLGKDHVRTDVLQGASAVLEAFSPWIVLEGGGTDADGVSRVLSEAGYRFYRVDQEKQLVQFHGRSPYPWAVACPEGKSPG